MRLPGIVFIFLFLVSPSQAVVLHAGDILVVGWSLKCIGLGGLYVPPLVRLDPMTGDHTCLSPLARNTIAIDVGATGELFSVALIDSKFNILRIDPATGAQTLVHVSPYLVRNLVVAGGQQLFLGTPYFIERVDLSTGEWATVDGTVGCSLVAMDFSGKLYCPNQSSGSWDIRRIDPDSGEQTIVSSGGELAGSTPYGIAVAPSGEILVLVSYPTSPVSGRLLRIHPLDGTQSVAAEFGWVSTQLGFSDIIDASKDILTIPILDYPVFRVNPVTAEVVAVPPDAYEFHPDYNQEREYWARAIAVIPGNLPDADNDSIADGFDNCPAVPNADQADRDGNRVGDACNDAEDPDGDDWANDLDNCPDAANADQADADGDGLGDPCDPFPTQADHVLAQALADLEQARADLMAAEQALADTQAELTATQEALAQCQEEPSQCLVPPAACSDGLDNDGDGLIDYPNDPQCTGPEGTAERRSACGLGCELALVLPLLVGARRRRQKAGG